MKTGKDVASFVSNSLKQNAFPPMPHSAGHGIGLDIHERPRLSLLSSEKLKGATMALEPAFYLSRYGMRFEETLHFDGKKARIF